MASPFSCIHCLRRCGFSRCSPAVIRCVVSHGFRPAGRASWVACDPAPAVLVHLCGVEEWSRAREPRRDSPRPCGSGEAPFIHLSTPEQVHLPANRLYRGRGDLVLLYIDPAALDSPVRWEPGVATDPESMLFPHLYGPLPARAVIRVTAHTGRGRWHLPAGRRISGLHVGVGFDLHQQLGCDQRGNFDHGGCGTCFAENLRVHVPDLAPARNIGHVDAGADHVGERRARLLESNLRCGAKRLGSGRQYRRPVRRRLFRPPPRAGRPAPRGNNRPPIRSRIRTRQRCGWLTCGHSTAAASPSAAEFRVPACSETRATRP